MNTLKHWLIAAVVGTALGAIGTAATVRTGVAQPAGATPEERAKHFFNEGKTKYNLGDFAKAVDLFKKAFEELDDGTFLYNIAQSYRELGNCKDALFFYKRFLALGPNSSKTPSDKKKPVPPTIKTDVDGHIKTLQECVNKLEETRTRQPDGTIQPDPDPNDGRVSNPTGNPSPNDQPGDGRVATGGSPGTGETDAGEEDDSPTTSRPKAISVHAGLGGAMIGAGDLPEEIPLQFSLGLGAGYPIVVSDSLVIDPGISIGFTPVPWTGAGMEGSASFTTLLANVGTTFAVTPKIAIRSEIGVGVLLFGGLGQGNPFTIGAVAATGALVTPAIRLGLSGEYAITKNIAAAVTPVAFSYSSAKEGLRSEISALTRVEFMVGIGYRM